MNTMTYKGYTARIEFDPADRLFVGRVAGINDVVGFHGEGVVALEAAFRDAVDDYRALCAQAGKEPERAFSGKVMFRVDPRTHAHAALAAQVRGTSLNQWADEALSEQAAATIEGWAISRARWKSRTTVLKREIEKLQDGSSGRGKADPATAECLTRARAQLEELEGLLVER